MKIRFDINGLDCPHCALKLQDMMNKLDIVNQADINFAFKSLVVDAADNTDEDALLAALQQTADGFEEGIKIDFRD
ncbi:MAG: cation transporter [Proteobacteria bacterium]|uniref:Cation transporter n=1 Tax=Candidatus Avisuccinivibrio stercorigallinarum TaxID=2840704 RepID=A0A9D9D8Z5_9GAMM|nr:cation transporter [Candidatus Avisuccinivibrio stercorigallinarum]